MYKSASWRELQANVANRGPAVKKVAAQAGQGRWNKRVLPKGANKTRGGKIGQMKTGRK